MTSLQHKIIAHAFHAVILIVALPHMQLVFMII